MKPLLALGVVVFFFKARRWIAESQMVPPGMDGSLFRSGSKAA